MKRLITIIFAYLLGTQVNAQRANAGPNKMVYLTKNNSTIIGGASSGTFYSWKKIYDVQPAQAGYPLDPATISSPGSATTKVTGLIQGVWYYQLAVTTGRITKKDTVVVRVDYDVPPANSTYLRSLQMANDTVYKFINNRSNTKQLPAGPAGVNTSEGTYIFDRSRSNGLMIDSSRGKFYSTIEDGYHWQNSTSYARAEGSFGSYYILDSNKTYCFEWKGYFPQDFSYMKQNQTVGGLMQVHGNNSISPDFGIALLYGIDGSNYSRGTPGVRELYFTDTQGNDVGGFYRLMYLDSMINKTHTVRMYVREGKGYPGQKAFLKVEIDGVQMYYRNTGQVGNTFQQDYPKFATVYDYENAIVNPDSLSRGRKFSMVTESYKIYTISGGGQRSRKAHK